MPKPVTDPPGEVRVKRQYPLRVGVDFTEAEASRLAALADDLRGNGADPDLVRALNKVAHALRVADLVNGFVPHGRALRPDAFPALLLSKLQHIVDERERRGASKPGNAGERPRRPSLAPAEAGDDPASRAPASGA